MASVKYLIPVFVILFLVSCGYVEETDFLQNPAAVPTTPQNTPPSLTVGITPQFIAGVVTQSIDADDVNTGGDTDSDGDIITYTCRYDNTIDTTVGSGLGDCTSLVNEDGTNPSFNPSTGVFSGWRPALNQIGTEFEFEIIGTDTDSQSSSVIFSGSVQTAGPSAWLQGAQTTSSTNFNQSIPYAIQWTNSDFDSAYFSHLTTVNPEQLSIKKAGNYFVAVTVPLTSAVHRACVRAEIRVNGSAVRGGVGESSYIRNMSNHSESSSHVALVLENLSADDIIEVYVLGTALTTGAATVTGAVSLYAEYIRSTRTVFTATATQTTLGTDLNQGAAAAFEWTEGLKSTGFTHDDVSSPENITLDEAGDYLVFVNVPITSIIQRGNIRVLVQDDGVTVPGGEGKQGYIRNFDGHNDASVHWSGLIRNVGAGSILTVKAQQEAENGTITVQPGQYASLFIEKIDSSINTFFSRSTRLAGPTTNWNPTSPLNILWENDIISYTSDFTHSVSMNPDRIMVNNDGDYLLIYNDSFTSISKRANPKIVVSVNGSAVSGAETKSHYIRNESPHSESSGSLVFLLKGLSAGDVITLASVAEAITGTVDDNQDSLLVLLRKM